MTLPIRHARVLENRVLAPGSHELILERGDISFRAGEEIEVQGPDPTGRRTYSLSGGEREAALRILFRVIPDGVLSPRLARLGPGDNVDFTGPFGSFILHAPPRPLCFVATGTGIAPLLSYIRTHPDARPTVLHGVRRESDLYARAEVESHGARYLPCVSGERCARAHNGRVTDLLHGLDLPADTGIYLCGSNAMIRDARELLRQRGWPTQLISAEPYYFW